MQDYKENAYQQVGITGTNWHYFLPQEDYIWVENAHLKDWLTKWKALLFQ